MKVQNLKDTCEVNIVHKETVEKVKSAMPDLAATVMLFKALADETRLKIAYALTLEEELCVCDVAAVIGSSNATASHHLRYLKDHHLAKSARKGKMVYYSLADDHILHLIQVAYEHAIEGEQQ